MKEARPPAPHIIVTRNLEAIYDIGTALRAFALVLATFPAARMTVAGSGPELDNLVALSRELGVAAQVTFAGRLDNGRDHVDPGWVRDRPSPAPSWPSE